MEVEAKGRVAVLRTHIQTMWKTHQQDNDLDAEISNQQTPHCKLCENNSLADQDNTQNVKTSSQQISQTQLNSKPNNFEDASGSQPGGSSFHHSPVDIKWRPEYGRYLVASRNVVAGEVLLKETPFLLVPRVRSEPACLACMKQLQLQWYDCNICGGPLCLPHCTGTNHSQAECTLLKRLGLQAPPHIDALIKELNILIGPLRVLLKIQDSKTAKDIILALQSHKNQRVNLPIGKFVQEHIVGGLQSRLGLQVSCDVVQHICGVLDTNAFEVTLDNDGHGRAICVVASLMNHSCLPNAQRWFTEGKMVVQAAKNIPKGHPILINYTQTLWGSQARGAHLSGFKLFKCNCLRCLDPMELGSHMSSVSCRECEGLVIPSGGTEGSWQCVGCGRRVEAGAVAAVVRGGASILSRLSQDSNAATSMSTLAHLTRVLGSQHYIVIQARVKIVNTIMKQQQTQDVPSESLSVVLDLTRDLLDLTTCIEPGLTRLTGLLLFQHTSAATELLHRCELRQNQLAVVDLRVNGDTAQDTIGFLGSDGGHRKGTDIERDRGQDKGKVENKDKAIQKDIVNGINLVRDNNKYKNGENTASRDSIENRDNIDNNDTTKEGERDLDKDRAEKQDKIQGINLVNDKDLLNRDSVRNNSDRIKDSILAEDKNMTENSHNNENREISVVRERVSGIDSDEASVTGEIVEEGQTHNMNIDENIEYELIHGDKEQNMNVRTTENETQTNGQLENTERNEDNNIDENETIDEDRDTEMSKQEHKVENVRRNTDTKSNIASRPPQNIYQELLQKAKQCEDILRYDPLLPQVHQLIIVLNSHIQSPAI